MPELTDNTDSLDRLVSEAMSVGAQAALMEAHRTLTRRRMYAAADALLAGHDSMLARVHATHEAQACIDKAREGA